MESTIVVEPMILLDAKAQVAPLEIHQEDHANLAVEVLELEVANRAKKCLMEETLEAVKAVETCYTKMAAENPVAMEMDPGKEANLVIEKLLKMVQEVYLVKMMVFMAAARAQSLLILEKDQGTISEDLVISVKMILMV